MLLGEFPSSSSDAPNVSQLLGMVWHSHSAYLVPHQLPRACNMLYVFGQKAHCMFKWDAWRAGRRSVGLARSPGWAQICALSTQHCPAHPPTPGVCLSCDSMGSCSEIWICMHSSVMMLSPNAKREGMVPALLG